MTYALETRLLQRRFGGLIATSDVSFTLPVGGRYALIGPNGAGKTTLINLLTGVLRPSSGTILLNGVDITARRPDHRVAAGLVRTFQINQLFPKLTPLQSVALATARRMGLDGALRQRLDANQAVVQQSMEVLERFGLMDVMAQPVATLAYGRQRLLEIALAVACGPKVLLLDEPAAGVPEAEREGILTGLAALPRDIAVLMIEHDMDLVFRFAEHILVLAAGAILTQGSPAQISADPKVREVYLGHS